MKKSEPTRRRKAVVAASTLVTFMFGVMLAVSVAGSASASGPLPTTTSTTSSTSPSLGSPVGGFDQNSPQAQFLVINGTVNATSDHEIVGSSAFPNYTTGAVDNYYSMAHAYMDNSPFGEGTASPADTGPIGQTAAAGNFQQPQYADARWPGGPANATYGKKGQPFAEAGAFESLATADASLASNGLSSPGLGGTKTLAVPKGFDNALTKALAGWKTKYLGCPAVPKTPAPPKLPLPKPPKVKVPSAPKVTTPTVTTPIATVAAPHTASAPPAPSISVVPAPAPAVPAPTTRSLSGVPSVCSSSGSGSDGESALTSSTLGVLVPGDAKSNTDINKVDTAQFETTESTTTTEADTTQTATTPAAWKPKPYTLMLGGESSMGKVTLGHGQIVIQGIHVNASVENDGTATPAYKASISVANASIGGVPVTIDENGVHVAGHHQGLPYQQASDSLNTALKQAGIQLFLVAPHVTNCGQAGTGTSTDTTQTTTTTDTTTTSADQSGDASACGEAGPTAMCDSGTGTGTDTTSTTTSPAPAPTPTPTSTDSSGSTAPPPSCPPPADSCGTTGTGTGTGTTTTGTTTTTATTPGIGGSTTTTSTGQTDTTSTTSSFCPSTAPMTSGCATVGTAPSTSSTSTDQSGTPPPPPGTDPMAMGTGPSQETIISATGVHVVFTQPVSPPGVPSQFVEHILGEVYVDSLAAPATPIPALGPLGPAGSFSSSSPSASKCGGGRHSSSTGLSSSGGGVGSSTAGGSSLTGGSAGSTGVGATGSALGATSSQTSAGGSSGGGSSLPASFAAALRKPLWLLLAYLVWQALVIGTGASLWNWRRDETT